MAETATAAAGPLHVELTFPLDGAERAAFEALPAEEARGLVAKAYLAVVQALEPGATPEQIGSLVWKRALFDKAKSNDNGEQRYVLGVVMEPDETDTQGDTQTADEIEKACFGWMEGYRTGGDTGHFKVMHKQIADGKFAILENYIQRADVTINGEKIKKGTWMMAIRVKDDEMWKSFKKGDFTGFSIGGTATRRPV